MNTSFNINDIYELLDLYKYASITGERVELIITPFEENGKIDDSKRVFTIGLQGGISRDRDTFVIEDAKGFDEKVLPQILAYYSQDDKLGKWDIVLPEVKDVVVTAKGVSETESGNLVYLESLNSDIYEEVTKKKQEVSEKTTYKKEKLTDEEKIWDEIILYAKNRRMMLDFYNGSALSEQENNIIYNFIVDLSNEKKVNIGQSKTSRENNEKLIEDIFNDKEQLAKYNIPEDLVERIVNTSNVKKLAQLVGAEKRVRRKIDFTNEDILSKVEFATKELDKVEYFNLKNASFNQFENDKFVSSQPSSINKLKEIYENENLYDKETREKYTKYCDEILGYLEKKAKNNKKIVKTKVDEPNIAFEKYDDAVIDSYEKFRETLDLIRYGKIDDEKYEIIVEPDRDDESKRRVRISLLNGVSRNDTFNFLFTDGKTFDIVFEEALEEIGKEDPNFKSEITFNKEPDVGLIKTVLHESQQGNEVLIKKANDELAYPKSTKIIEDDNSVDKELPLTIDDSKLDDSQFLSQLEKLESEINEEARRQDEEKSQLEEPKQEIDTTVSFEKLHEYVQTYKIGNSTGALQIFYRDAGREYIPSDESEKRNIEFATYWSVAAGIEDSEDDVVIGEKYAFNEESKKLFNIFDIQFRESVKRGIPVDLYALKEQFINSGVNNADKVYDRLFRNRYYVDYVVQYYKKSFGMSLNDDELKNPIKEALYVMGDKDLTDSAMDEAKRIIQRNEIEEINESSVVEAKRIIEQNKYDDLVNDAKEQAKMIHESNEKADLLNGAEEQAKEIYNKNEKAQLVEDAKEQAKMIHENNEKADLLNGAEEQARLLMELRDSLFEIVKQQEEKQVDPEIEELKDAFEVVESYATLEQPTSLKVFFDKENPGFAEVIVSNGIGEDETVMYQRTFDEKKLMDEIIPVLCKLYAKDNNVTYNETFDVPNTNKGGLVVVGTLDKTFQVSNADKEIIKKTQEELNKELLQNKNDKNKTK